MNTELTTKREAATFRLHQRVHRKGYPFARGYITNLYPDGRYLVKWFNEDDGTKVLTADELSAVAS